jgi:hypothetical protein
LTFTVELSTKTKVLLSQTGAASGGSGPNAVLCKTGGVLLNVLEQPRLENFSAGHNWEQFVHNKNHFEKSNF